ncbi:hypothetical protein [Salinivibrio sp. MA607]|uniref:hypothetical protein n=1 Tax=Salinivibrio sp. MA607 TaxID=1909457 RepID=UPI001301462F|nr:hypothetical protein [Salinivibrio sp. MA607]
MRARCCLGASCTAPVTIGAKFDFNVGWRAAQITPSLCDREGAYADLRDIQAPEYR